MKLPQQGSRDAEKYERASKVCVNFWFSNCFAIYMKIYGLFSGKIYLVVNCVCVKYLCSCMSAGKYLTHLKLPQLTGNMFGRAVMATYSNNRTLAVMVTYY